ncbi:organoarsenical effux MFS transporter ArsJ [Aliidiomarina sp. B3213]|nr:organoarsenical effux MFS transporter ArsJ [Aliidiomarina sp. B3213]RTE86811.1 MFS transporter [Aliidiomarina sp. B3213]TCZ91022.1 organoarsenical effux MFS transporter ArsJ [Lysobacter sp. N42]
MFSFLKSNLGQYAVITGNYWAFTLTDGALRMLVVLYFYQLGYSGLEVALLFVFYEFFGIVTNLFGGWLGAKWGLNRTMNIGLALQVLALSMLLVPTAWLSVIWVMAAQALSGIAKDLNKMSAKSTIKTLVRDTEQSKLYKWVAILTGSKNTLKGVGFFLGGLMLTLVGFQGAILIMAISLTAVWVSSLLLLKADTGKASFKPKFSDIWSKSRAINMLSAARLFLFGARDIWFVIALPLFLASQLAWSHWQVSAFLAFWVIAYGFVQALAPRFAQAKHLSFWGILLALTPAAIGFYLANQQAETTSQVLGYALILGLGLFGLLFAVNSSIHSYLIVSSARADGVSLDVGFYYMANAAGRLLGTVLSGWIYQTAGLVPCLIVSSLFLLLATAIVGGLPKTADV